MQRLRHPVRAIREPFGKAGLIVAIFALVMAMVGGAYAAGKLTSGQKKEVEKNRQEIRRQTRYQWYERHQRLPRRCR